MSVEVATNSALYDKGIFSTLAIHEGAPLFWEKHWRRLRDDAVKIGIDLSEYSEAITRTTLDETVAKNNSVNGRARITFIDETPSAIWTEGGGTRTRLSIVTGEFRPTTEQFWLTLSPYSVNSRSPLAGVKSCNYLEHILSLEEASKRGFHEAVRLNEKGEVASACMANIFWLRENRICTPALSTGCLAGTTREYVLENIECEEVEAGIEEIERADAIFLTSAGLGVVEVAEFESRKLERSEHPILDLLAKAPKTRMPTNLNS